MTEHRLNQTAAEVQAIQDGSRTRISTPIDPQPKYDEDSREWDWRVPGVSAIWDAGDSSEVVSELICACAPWQVGDLIRLWEQYDELEIVNTSVALRVLDVRAYLVAETGQTEALAHGFRSTLDPAWCPKDRPARFAFRDDWTQRHPGHPFDTAWAWGMGFEVVR